MYDVHFPVYSYRSFTSDELEYTEPDSLKELNRYDYINLTRLPIETKRKMLREMLDNYIDVEKQGFEYKDCILQRYFYKQFVIRENTDDAKQVRYYKYTLSDWNEESKSVGLDDRVLTIEIYTKFPDDELFRDVCYKLKVGHKAEIIDQMNGTKDKYDDFGSISDENLYIIPLYFVTEEGNKYVRIWEMKARTSKQQESIMLFFLQAMYRFCIFNLYMLNKVEMDEKMVFEDTRDYHFEVDNMIDYIKRNPKADKHVLIRDFKYNLSIKMKPIKQNIYSRDNKTIRTLCDYQFQVHGYYEHYWCGSKKDGTRHRELRWIDSYPKNIKKKFRVIKEHEKEGHIIEDESN